MKALSTSAILTLAFLIPQSSLQSEPFHPKQDSDAPNILFIVLDDTGIDTASWQPFGWTGGGKLPATPVLPVMQAIADDGISFTNFWATPECSPSRACFLTGRLGFRSGVSTAIVSPMLPSKQLNAAEVTLPTLLKERGYRVGMFGKYHLAGDASGTEAGSVPNTPPGHGYESPSSTAGLDDYSGYWSLPPAIDTTVSGQTDGNGAPCGYPISTTRAPNLQGAACFPIGDCSDEGGLSWECVTDLDPVDALALGGIPLLNESGGLETECGDCERIRLCDGNTFDQDLMNAYYAWPQVTVDAKGSYTPEYPLVEPTREYITDWVSNRSAEWISEREDAGDRWMCFVTHSAAHTPIQTPPTSAMEDSGLKLDCSLPASEGQVPTFRKVYANMMEQADESIGRMLVDLGYATIGPDGFRLADLTAQNVQLVVMADNGSYGFTVFPPFDPTKAKQTVYQTGIWVPCMVAGAGVEVERGSRTAVAHPVNVVDLFELFCSSAGIDPEIAVQKRAPGRLLDARAMSPYLADPTRRSIRQGNIALYQSGQYPATPETPEWIEGGIAGGCIIGNQFVDQLISSEKLCTANGGIWLGEYGYCHYYEIWKADPCDPILKGFDFGSPFDDNCRLADCTQTCVTAPTRGQWTIRRDQYKLIILQYPDCTEASGQNCQIEFYALNDPSPPLIPGRETSFSMLDLENLTPVQTAVLTQLKAELLETLLSETYCPGDGNLDGRVDELDLTSALADWGQPSWWDIDRSGTFDGRDLGALLGYWNPDCAANVVPRKDLAYNSKAYIPYCLE